MWHGRLCLQDKAPLTFLSNGATGFHVDNADLKAKSPSPLKCSTDLVSLCIRFPAMDLVFPAWKHSDEHGERGSACPRDYTVSCLPALLTTSGGSGRGHAQKAAQTRKERPTGSFQCLTGALASSEVFHISVSVSADRPAPRSLVQTAFLRLYPVIVHIGAFAPRHSSS